MKQKVKIKSKYILLFIITQLVFSCTTERDLNEIDFEINGANLPKHNREFLGLPNEKQLFSADGNFVEVSITKGFDKYNDILYWKVNDSLRKVVSETRILNLTGSSSGSNTKISLCFTNEGPCISSFVSVGIMAETGVSTQSEGIYSKISENPEEAIINKTDKENSKNTIVKNTSDSDGDGIPDNKDNCPNEPGNKLNNGCPAIAKDADKDGIPDDQDACPMIAGTNQYRGCPPPADTDGDGIPDNRDKCPNQYGSTEKDGCPEARKTPPASSGPTYRLASVAALDDENESAKNGVIRLKPGIDLYLLQANLVANTDGKIELTLEGDDIKREVTIIKAVNPGKNTIRFNDFKNNVLRAGKNYTITFKGLDDVELTLIKNAIQKESISNELSITGKMIFYDVVFNH